MTTNVLPGVVNADMNYGGRYLINGTVDRLGVVGQYHVRCYHHYTGRLLRETWSNTSGSYLFSGLKLETNGYFVVAFDRNATPLNAAISDLITPVTL